MEDEHTIVEYTKDDKGVSGYDPIEYKGMNREAYKLFRVKKNGDITSLFINKSRSLNYNEWMKAECFPTKGFKERPHWHCTDQPNAPHLSEKGRVWLRVEMNDYTEFKRPVSQGGKWYLANNIKILKDE